MTCWATKWFCSIDSNVTAKKKVLTKNLKPMQRHTRGGLHMGLTPSLISKKNQQQKQFKLKRHHLPTIQITRNHPHKIWPARLALKGTVFFFLANDGVICCLNLYSLFTIFLSSKTSTFTPFYQFIEGNP